MQSCLGCIRDTFKYIGTTDQDPSAIIAKTLEPYYQVIRNNPRYQDYIHQRNKIFTGALPDKTLPFTEDYLHTHSIRSWSGAELAGRVYHLFERVESCFGKRTIQQSAMYEIQEVIIQERKCLNNSGKYAESSIETEARNILNQMMSQFNHR